MSPLSEAGAAVAAYASSQAADEDARRQVVEHWAAGESLRAVAAEAEIPLEDVESILLTVLFDFS